MHVYQLPSPKEVCFLSLTEAADSNVRQELFLEDILGILDSLLPGNSRLGPPHSNEVECHILLLYDKGLVQRRLQL